MKGIHGIIAPNRKPVLNYAVRNAKFAEEKVCMENERWMVQFDGILLDHAKPSSSRERFELLTSLYQQHGGAMTVHLKGQFGLVLWDKAKGSVLVANDLLSKRSLYYCIHQNALYYAASYYDLLDLLSEAEGYCPAVCAEAVKQMTAGGALAGNITYAADVHYLDAFQAIVFDVNSGKISIEEIRPEKHRAVSGMEEAIETFDKLFTSAVKAQFAKNAEYGYEHTISLSGGMDSRACLLKAVREGYDRGITCVTYSQAGSIDYTVSQQIAFDCSLDYLFYPMDAAVFMNRLPLAMDCNECQQSSIGSTGAGTLARLLDKSRMGIMHVGLCGGELMGDLVECSVQGRIQKLLSRLALSSPNEQTFHFQQRTYLDNVRACQNFSSMFLPECETVSPFLDEDVVLFVTSLPPHLLYRRQLYRRWMIRFIPNAYPTTMFCGPVDISPLREIANKIADRLARRLFGASKRDMNPIEFWFANHPKLAEQCADEYQRGMEKLQSAGVPEEVLSTLRTQWQTNHEHKLYTLTALRALNDLRERFGTLSSAQ